VNKKQGDNLQPPKAKSKRRRRNKGMCLEDRPVFSSGVFTPMQIELGRQVLLRSDGVTHKG
jgi:hypothetical protein